jgi:hypothetical protein
MAKRVEGRNVFLNFHDQRGRVAKEMHQTIQSVVEEIPTGSKVVLVVSKDQFGEIQIPLDIGAAEIIA